uniref:Uncharacterized protein n=1 Tax=Solanum tuberosum TaxID=4113 RepID=M1DM36_SOLTU
MTSSYLYQSFTSLNYQEEKKKKITWVRARKRSHRSGLGTNTNVEERASSSSVTLGDLALHRGTVRRHADCSFLRRLDFLLRAFHTGTLGEIMVIRRLVQWVRRSSGLLFFVLSTTLFLCAH